MKQALFNYINGQWIPSESEATLSSLNPIDNEEVVGTIQDSTLEDLEKAVQAAKKARKQWRSLSSVVRGQYLQKAADILEQRADEIARMATREMGKVLADTKGEALRGVAILRFYAQEGLRKIGDIVPSSQSENFMFTTRAPLGTVGVISPWNFPIAIPIWKIAPALVYGNTVVFKPATETAVTALLLAEVFEQAGLPAGVINFITGRGSTIGNGMIHHPDIDGITFTGSNAIGQQVARGAAARGARYQLEMGGKNPSIILKDADLDHAARLTVFGAMKQTGQRCTATSIAYIELDVYEQFKEKVVEKAKLITVGNGLDGDFYMGPLASRNQQETVLGYIKQGVEEGANLIYGGKVPDIANFAKGCFVEPTIFENVTTGMTIAHEEIFGPVLCLIKVESFEQAVEYANSSKFGLSASVFTRDLSKALTFINEIEAGMVKVNGETGSAEPQVPFGGVKSSSSLSREQGQAAAEFFTTIKTVTITPTP